MKKIKKISVLIILMGLILLAPHDAKALSLDVLANSGISTSGTVPCSGYYCYNTNNEFKADNYSSYRYNIYGFRVSLIDKNTGNIVTGSRTVDYIPGLGSCSGDIKNRRNCFSGTTKYNETDLIYILGKNGSGTYKRIKQDYIGTNWAAANSELLDALDARNDGLDVSENSWFFNKFISDLGTQESAAKLGSPAVTTAFKRRLDKLKETYNNGSNEVFGTGSDKDAVHAIVREILGNNDLPEDQVKDYLQSCNIQIEIITRIDLGLNFSGKGFRRYHIIGTTSDIYAFALYVSKHYYETSDLFGRAVTFLYDLHNSFYTTESLYGYDAGNSTICNTKNMKDQNKSSRAFSLLGNETFACGVATISGLESTPVCKIEEVDGNKIFYGSDGQKMSGTILGCTAGSTEECYKERFIEECGCEIAKNNNLNLGSSEKYWNNKCNPTIVTDKKYCTPTATADDCSGTLTIKDDEDCIFADTNINKTVLDSLEDDHNYTTYANKYCNISCAEKIEFKLPVENFAEKGSSNPPVNAGMYYTLKPTAITSTGTRTCRATLAMGTFENTVSKSFEEDEKYGNLLEILTKDPKKFNFAQKQQLQEAIAQFTNIIHDIIGIELDDGEYKVKLKDNNTYSYKQQNQALIVLYDAIQESYTGTEYGTCATEDGNGVTQYQAKVNVYGFNFSAEKCRDNSFIPSDLTSNSSTSLTLSKFKDAVKAAIKDTASQIYTEVNTLNGCRDHYNGAIQAASYDFAPNLIFKYDELYSSFFKEKFFNKENITEPSSEDVEKISENKQVSYTSFSSSGKINESQEYAFISGTDQNRYAETKVTKTYSFFKSPVTFYAAIPSGEAVIKSSAGNNMLKYDDNVITETLNFQKLTTDEYDVYPIALNREDSTYNYSYTVSSLGDNSILNNSGTGRMDNFLKKDAGIGNKSDRTYYCNYEVKNDLTTPDKPNFFYRNISLNKFNPNSRDLGKNWAVTNAKAEATLKEIEKTGTTDDPEEIYNNPEYSFTLTPTNMQNIRIYNRGKEKKHNGYADFNMKKVNENGEESENGIWYQSNFLRNDCNECFDMEKKNDSWTAWTDGVAKLSGTGPAWK